jgi:hypothetical protein
VTRVGVFGWGVVAPRSPNIDAFAENLGRADTWLTPFRGFGPNNFLVGYPEFDFEAYRGWVEARFPPSRFHQLADKMGTPTQYTIGSFIQALGQNPGLEEELRRLDTGTHVYIGTGVGDVSQRFTTLRSSSTTPNAAGTASGPRVTEPGLSRLGGPRDAPQRSSP